MAIGAVLMAGPVAAGPFSLSEQDEIKAGEQVRQQAYKEYGRPVAANDARQQRVNRMGAMFKANVERKNIPYTYTVLQNDQVLNAFAAPGGPVFVTTKLVATAANDAELAFVLGHETGHIERKHIVKSVEKQQTVGLVAGILGSLLGGGKTSDLIGGLTNVTYTLWQRGYSRDQERDADVYGIRAMAKLGFDPAAGVSMLGKLGSGGGGLEKYLATHPDPKSRQKNTQELIKKEGLADMARRMGGPFLNLSGTNQNVYQPVNSGGTYTGSNAGPTDAGGYINLGAPLRLQPEGNSQVVLAPAGLTAEWAGGQASFQGNRVTIRRGNSSVVFSANSSVATLNGRQAYLPTRAVWVGNRFYVPLGSLVAGLGGEAGYDKDRNAVSISIRNGRSGWVALP